MIAKYFATSLAMEKVVSAPRVMRSCLPISTISISFVGIAVEVDHVAGLARRHRAGIHGHAHVSLGQRRGIVRAVAAHGDELALGLLLADQVQLVLGRCLRQEIVHPGFGCDGGGGQRIVARDHDGADAHAAQLGEALADTALHDVFQMDEPEQAPVSGDGKRRPACRRNRFGRALKLAAAAGMLGLPVTCRT